LPPSAGETELVIDPRFTGRSFVAVLRVLVGGESALVQKLDLAKDGARKALVQMVAERLPGVKATDVEAQLRKLCDDRAKWLRSTDELAAEKGEDPTLVDLLVAIADEAELFRDAAQAAYATIQVDGHFETWPVRSKGFRLWLRRRLREEHGKRLVRLGRIPDGLDGMGASPAANRQNDNPLLYKELQPSEDGTDGMDGVAPIFSEAEVEFSDEVNL